MARIAGINIPTDKKIGIALTAIFGLGRVSAHRICEQAKVDLSKRVHNLSEDEIARLREIVDRDYCVEGELRRDINVNIKRLADLGSYRGIRHRKGLPVRGQHTHANARTRKGRARPIAGKKAVGKK